MRQISRVRAMATRGSLRASLALAVAGLLASVALAAASVASFSPASRGVFSSARESGAALKLAAGKRLTEGGAAKPPIRGSSAELNGGSSADRYGGNSADKRGVAGRRDARLYPQRKKTVEKSGADKHAEQDAGQQERDQERELDPDREAGEQN